MPWWNGDGPGGGRDRRRMRNRDSFDDSDYFQVQQPSIPQIPAQPAPRPLLSAPVATPGAQTNTATSGTSFDTSGSFGGGFGGGGGPSGVGGQGGGVGAFGTEGWIFDPNSSYGSTQYGPGDFLSSPIGEQTYQNDPDAAMMRRTAESGIDPMSQRGRVAQGLSGRIADAYNSAILSNPLLRRMDFMKGIDVNDMLANMTTAERGETPGRFAGRARTIARGYGG